MAAQPTASLRRATPDDVSEVEAFVRAVIVEVYPTIVADRGEPDEDRARWKHSHVAEADGFIVGVGLASGDSISDLWVARGWRGRGIGAALLGVLEAQMRAGGFERGRLRCVAANVRARAFYRRAGWVEGRPYPHERNRHPMVDLTKTL